LRLPNTVANQRSGWNTQLVARKAGASSKPLDVDAEFKESQKEYLLLWRNSEKSAAPFNLTPFAITLVSYIHTMTRDEEAYFRIE